MAAEPQGRVRGDAFERAGMELENLDVHPVSIRINRPPAGDWTKETLEVFDDIGHPDTFPPWWPFAPGRAACGTVPCHAIPAGYRFEYR